MKKICTSITLLVLFSGILHIRLSAQNLPSSMHLSTADHILYTNGQPTDGLYDEAVVRTYQLWFSQTNYWQLLTANYATHTDIPATLIVEGDTFPEVGVRFKGQTSYSQSGSSQKKSFNITLDYVNPDQSLNGYSTINLNNCFQDASFMREMVYLHQIRRHVPAAKAAYVHLFINGESWG
ncbi:MAG TPA: CotH kinase family protein, partial [Saprospiraceae bacterium]|nr:CotH kinase family protein [Saprospiraceae bacterium]